MKRFLPLMLPASAAAAESAAPAVSAGSVFQMFFGLTAVLAVILAAAWFVKRAGSRHPTGSRALRVIAGAAVGQRERVVLVEVGPTWLVVGVAPGSVRTLHTLPRVESAPEASTGGTAPRTFAGWLQQMMENRRGR